MKKLLIILPLRLLALLFLALPLTPLFDHPLLSEPEFAMILDISPSMRERFPDFPEEALEEWRSLDEGSHPVVFFDDHPRAFNEYPPIGDSRYTDLAAALRAGLEILPAAAKKRLLLVSDGLSRMDGIQEVLSLLSKET